MPQITHQAEGPFEVPWGSSPLSFLLFIYLDWFQLGLETDVSTVPVREGFPAARKQVVSCNLHRKGDSVRGFPNPTWLGPIWEQVPTDSKK